MRGDSWPEEPNDPFPEYTDPERVEGADPGVAETASDIVDVPEEVSRRFWSLVVVLNLGLLASALGLMLVAFRGQLLVGGLSFGLGVGTLGYGVVKYRQSRRAIRREGETDGETDTDADPDTD